MEKKRLIIGMSGASGAPVTVELLRQLRQYRENVQDVSFGAEAIQEIETHLIYTKGAEMTLKQETDCSLEELCQLADVVYDNEDIGAGPASGSYKTLGMIVVPCSMKTVAGIVSGYSDNLLLRAADVTLKERRKLVLVARECPLGTIHLRNLYELSQMGAVVLPLMLSYYNHPQTVENCTRHIVGKILDLFGIEGQGFHRWTGEE